MRLRVKATWYSLILRRFISSLLVVSALRGTVRTTLPGRKQPSPPKMTPPPSRQGVFTVVTQSGLGPALTMPVDQDRRPHWNSMGRRWACHWYRYGE